MQQDQKRYRKLQITKNNQEKQRSKKKKKKSVCQKNKSLLTNKNCLPLVADGLKKSQIDLIVYEDYILGIYNIWCEVIRMKNRLY